MPIDFESYADTPEVDFEAYADTPSGPGMLDPRAGVPDFLAPPEYSAGDVIGAIGTGLVQGATFGTAPYISALTDFGSDKPFGERVDEQLAAYKGRRAASPKLAMAADMAASIPSMVAASPFAIAGKAKKIGKLGMFGANAVDSALQNAVRGSLDDGSLENTTNHAGIGLAGGAIGQVLGTAVNRSYEGSKVLAGSALAGLKRLRDRGLEKFGSTEFARMVANPDAAIASVTGPLDKASKDVFNRLADVMGVDSLGTSASKVSPQQRASAISAVMEQTGASSPQAATELVDQALASGAESGATLGGVLRLIVKDDPAAVAKRYNTAYDAWSPIAENIDPRATQARGLTGSLRSAFEAGDLNRALGKGDVDGRAYDVGRMGSPGYANEADFLAHGDAPIGLRPGDPMERRWSKLQGPQPPTQIPSTDLGVRPVTAETATGDDIYQMLKTGTDLPFSLDQGQLSKMTDMERMVQQYGPLGRAGPSRVKAMGSGTKKIAAPELKGDLAKGGGDDVATGVVRTPQPIEQVDPSSFGVEPGGSLVPELPPPPAPDMPAEPDLFGFDLTPPSRTMADPQLVGANNRDTGRNALNRLSSAVLPAIGFSAGGMTGAAIGGAAALGNNLAIDVFGALGSKMAASGRKNLTPGALASTWLENPSILQSVAQRPDALGRSASWALQGMQDRGVDGLKARAFVLALDPQIRAYMAEQQD